MTEELCCEREDLNNSNGEGFANKSLTTLNSNSRALKGGTSGLLFFFLAKLGWNINTGMEKSIVKPRRRDETKIRSE